MSLRAIVALCLIVLSAVPAAGQERTLPVLFTGSPNASASVASIDRGGLVYGSAVDLAAALGLKATEVRKGHKLEIKPAKGKLTLIDATPFVLTNEPSNRKVIRQLPVDVLSVDEVLYVPVKAFLAVLNTFLSHPAEFDPVARCIRVVRERNTPVAAAPVRNADISSVSMESLSNGMMIHIPTGRAIDGVEQWLRPDGWLYVTIPGVKGNVQSLNAQPGEGFVKKIVAIQSPGSLQLTFKLSGAVESVERVPADSTGITLTLRTPPPAPASPAPQGNAADEKRDRWALDVVVIDAGHGGRDWGASGVSGVREKDVTLGIALKLGTLIKRHVPGVRVVYTRDNDRFVELDRRGQIANEADGKLFISIHCNSLKRKPNPTRGFEVYLLRPGRTGEAIAIAERENAVIKLEEGYEEKYKHLTDENFILTTMARSADVKASEVFADLLQHEMETYAGVPNRGVKQAGFYVLVGASMPNVLVETAYLSNREDERFLKGEVGQQKIAESIYRAVRKYKAEYEKLLGMGKSPVRAQ